MKGQLRLLSGQKIKSPNNLTTRPTTSLVREALINILGKKTIDSSWLDLFSGSGIISCEAIQAGAKTIIAIDSDKKTAQICASNLSVISNQSKVDSSIKCINTDVLKWLKVGRERKKEKYQNAIPSIGFDFVYLDPPYRSNLYIAVLECLILGDWINKASLVICESSSSINFELPNPWVLKDKRVYGKSKLTFITPIQE